MAHTVTNITRVKTGNRTIVFAKFIFDTGYPTGGEPLDASLFGLNKIDSVVASGAAVDAGTTGFGTFVNSADETTWKIGLLGAATGDLITTPAAGTALSETTVADQSLKHCRIVICGY